MKVHIAVRITDTDTIYIYIGVVAVVSNRAMLLKNKGNQLLTHLTGSGWQLSAIKEMSLFFAWISITDRGKKLSIFLNPWQ